MGCAGHRGHLPRAQPSPQLPGPHLGVRLCPTNVLCFDSSNGSARPQGSNTNVLARAAIPGLRKRSRRPRPRFSRLPRLLWTPRINATRRTPSCWQPRRHCRRPTFTRLPRSRYSLLLAITNSSDAQHHAAHATTHSTSFRPYVMRRFWWRRSTLPSPVRRTPHKSAFRRFVSVNACALIRPH